MARRRITGSTNMSVRVIVNGQEVNNFNGGNGYNDQHQEPEDDGSPKQCPQCGDTIQGESRICPSCGFISNPQRMQKSLSELESAIAALKSNIDKNTYGKEYHEILANVNNSIITIREQYGKNPETKEKLENLEAEKNAIIKKGKNKSNLFAFGCAGFIIIVIGIIVFSKYFSDPTPEQMIEEKIKEKNIGKAKALLTGINDKYKKAEYQETLSKMEIDSLTDAKNYDEALRISGQLPELTDQLEKSEMVIDRYVNELVKNKEFDKAREKTALLSNIYMRDKLIEVINLAEQQSK